MNYASTTLPGLSFLCGWFELQLAYWALSSALVHTQTGRLSVFDFGWYSPPLASLQLAISSV